MTLGKERVEHRSFLGWVHSLNCKKWVIWIALRTEREIWDIERALWIYDIIVDKEYRRKGLGRKLIARAEEYARTLGRNIGLFVHEHNFPAQQLYESQGYAYRAYPLVIEPKHVRLQKSPDLIVREQEPQDEKRVEMLGLRRFRRLVLFSTDASDADIVKRYEELLRRRFSLGSNQQRFVLESPDEGVVGFVWVGRAKHNKKTAAIYDFAVGEEPPSGAGQMLLSQAVHWAAEKDCSSLYFQLHAEHDIELELCRSMGFELLGCIMEKMID
ncbi:MAG: GNAT family N-acetyltransferase [Candidatus Thorarchaeota archaeon]